MYRRRWFGILKHIVKSTNKTIKAIISTLNHKKLKSVIVDKWFEDRSPEEEKELDDKLISSNHNFYKPLPPFLLEVVYHITSEK